MLTISKYNLIESDWSGQLGIVMAVYNGNRSHILVGQRAENNPYRPEYFSLVGGIIEHHDLAGSLRECCIRELNEENKIDVDCSSMELVGFIPNLERVGVQLVINVYTELNLLSDLVTNEVWEKSSLQWYETNSLSQFKGKNMLNDLKLVINILE